MNGVDDDGLPLVYSVERTLGRSRKKSFRIFRSSEWIIPIPIINEHYSDRKHDLGPQKVAEVLVEIPWFQGNLGWCKLQIDGILPKCFSMGCSYLIICFVFVTPQIFSVTDDLGWLESFWHTSVCFSQLEWILSSSLIALGSHSSMIILYISIHLFGVCVVPVGCCCPFWFVFEFKNWASNVWPQCPFSCLATAALSFVSWRNNPSWVPADIPIARETHFSPQVGATL